MNEHVFQAEQGIVGHAIVELGRAETYLLRCARCQTGELNILGPVSSINIILNF
ncbi:hypothetical protein DPMN_088319 [Dreissena polymorpha]|uniref:Uncharacterized protein n=1 Tax=Dreissena polymorpha TaxID=45954 RepID=A0A9D4KTX4_DREPO|nr:hypothetical protein DPMN_088319 [Dreissena polymorpha]